MSTAQVQALSVSLPDSDPRLIAKISLKLPLRRKMHRSFFHYCLQTCLSYRPALLKVILFHGACNQAWNLECRRVVCHETGIVQPQAGERQVSVSLGWCLSSADHLESWQHRQLKHTYFDLTLIIPCTLPILLSMAFLA